MYEHIKHSTFRMFNLQCNLTCKVHVQEYLLVINSTRIALYATYICSFITICPFYNLSFSVIYNRESPQFLCGVEVLVPQILLQTDIGFMTELIQRDKIYNDTSNTNDNDFCLLYHKIKTYTNIFLLQ